MKAAVFVLFAGLIVGFPAAHADERRQVALLEFSGPLSDNVRGDVMRIVAAKCWVSSVSRLDGRSLRELASDYELDLVIEGSVEKRGRDYRVRIRFVNATGKLIGSTTVVMQRLRLDRAARRQVERQLTRAIAATPPRANGVTAYASP